MDASYNPHSLSLGLKQRMAQKSADKFCGSIVSHIEPKQAVSGMQQIAIVKVLVQAEEGRLGQMVQDGNKVFIIVAPSGHIDSDNTESDAPLMQQLPLPGGQ